MKSEPSSEPLIRRLADGWGPNHYGSAETFLQRWRERVSPTLDIKEIGQNFLYFMTDLPGVHLLGADDVHVLMLARTANGAETLKLWHRKVSAPRRLLLILAFSEAAPPLAEEIYGNERTLMLSPSEIAQLLGSADPRNEIKTVLRLRLPIRALTPYNYLRPAHGHLFFGRQEELGRLLQEDDTSFAIAGPGRIGKTSLIQQYQRVLKKQRDPRALRLFEIDFYACRNSSSQEVARFFAMKVDPSSRSHRMMSDGLIDFLRYQHRERGGPLELVLDEVDEVCQGAAFDSIGEAAKQGLCRLIMCGRGQLFRMLLSQASPLACRLDLIRPGPLEVDEARSLLLLPLADLDIKVSHPEAVAEKLFKLTGRLPHLLQFYGKKITELVSARSANSVSEEMIEALSWDLDTAQYVTSPLRELNNPHARLLALALLKENPSELTIPAAQSLAERYGLHLTYNQTADTLNELVINSVLSWKKGIFTLASEALPSYAARLGHLDTALPEAKAQI
jgi:hypothetical protein